MTLRDDWAAFTALDTETWDHFEFTDKELALAHELARLFQADPPTIEQVSYFVEDAEGVASSLPDQPWTIRKAHMSGQRFDWLVLVNDVLCGVEDSDDMQLEVLGRMPAEWESVDSGTEADRG
jgi:hypothetical protein